ncbi:MAG TPA: AraC family transcriptional regulator [Kribbellaceae bacterium]|nr:AraC family transcriptional regulator [Kribbellaceae bacterium]
MAGDRASGPPAERMTAWRPAVPGVAETLHARFVRHAYPAHVHDAWTLLIVDSGAIRYDLDRHAHGAGTSVVTLLPPGVVHDGRTATPAGFRKRVVYLEPEVVGASLAGAAVDRPELADPLLRHRVHQLHLALAEPGEGFQAESRLALVAERLRHHLTLSGPQPVVPSPPRLAADLRDLLDERLTGGLTLLEAGAVLGAHPAHLVRSFTAAFGLPPHAYLTARRVDRARRLLLAGARPAEVATAVGFYDQAHLNRHFKRHLGTTPARFAAVVPAPPSDGVQHS